MSCGMDQIHIGTSGWNYPHWKGPFYPEKCPAKAYFGIYKSVFNTVEVNNSFYRLPEEGTIDQWTAQADQHFLFSVKASRYITHMKKLKDPREPVKTFLDRVSRFGKTLGPILFQLPPHFHCNTERLECFLSLLDKKYRYTFEFRDPSWLCREVYRVLENFNAAVCVYELSGEVSPREVTADFVYIRLHGPGKAYEGKYDKQTLSGWAGAISTWTAKGLDVFCYFDNDQEGFAPANAQELLHMLTGK